MPMLGYKRKFKNIDSLKDDVFIINFDLKYSDAGALHINNEIESPFDVGDYRIMIDDAFEKSLKEVFKRYDKSKYDIDDHFALYHKMVDIGSKVTRNYKNI